MLENYEGTAIDPEIFGQSETEPKTQTEEDATVEPENTGVEEENTETQNASTVPTEFEIEGIGKVSIKDIQEWRQGNLRQSDYTRKTQELAKQREETKDAVEVFNYLKQNPQLVQQLKAQEANVRTDIIDKATPENAMLKDVMYQQKAMQTDMKLAELKSKYGEIDEVALLTKATELRTEDLEFVYKALRFDSSNNNDAVAKAKQELLVELEQNRQKTGTTINTRQSSNVQKNKVTLTDDEKRVAEGMGISETEYAKWVQR